MPTSPLLEQAQALQERMVAWRRDIHMHPELGFEEVRTAGLVADELRALGLEVQTGVGKTGVVAYIGDGAPVIGIRADMDALPIHEETDLPFASQTPGKMHACGHDSHTAMLLGAAHLLVNMPDRPAGQFRLLFQPSEEMQDGEGKSGAVRMIEDSALDGVDRTVALHVASTLPTGKIEILGGHVMAAVDTLLATIHGEGCHGASPHEGIDPIFIAAQVINALHGIRARRIKPIDPAVISIGSIHAGNADNVIPRDVKITGTIRSFSQEVREQLHRDIEAAFGVARALGGDYSLRIRPGYPATYNDPTVAEMIRVAAVDLFGEEQLHPGEPSMGAEDFSYMTARAPGAMFMLGAKRDDVNRPHHSPIFDIDESVMPTGAALLVESAVRLAHAAEPSQR